MPERADLFVSLENYARVNGLEIDLQGDVVIPTKGGNIFLCPVQFLADAKAYMLSMAPQPGAAAGGR